MTELTFYFFAVTLKWTLEMISQLCIISLSSQYIISYLEITGFFIHFWLIFKNIFSMQLHLLNRADHKTKNNNKKRTVLLLSYALLYVCLNVSCCDVWCMMYQITLRMIKEIMCPHFYLCIQFKWVE